MKFDKSKRNMADRIVLQSKSNRPIDQQQFYIDIEEKILEGYRIAKNTLRDDQSLRMMYGFQGHVVMYLDGKEFIDEEESTEETEETTQSEEGSDNETQEESTEESVEEILLEEVGEESGLSDDIKTAKTKKDLLDVASKYSIEVPDDLKTVPVIRKYLKDQSE